MNLLVLFGRILYASVFLMSVPNHFAESTIEYAAGHGVPMAGILAPLAGVIVLMGGVGILVGYKTKVSAWLIVLYLTPVTLMIHDFWNFANPSSAVLEQIQFSKNLSLLGAALLIAYFGPGPFNLENWTERRARERQSTKMIDLTRKR